VKLNGVIGWKYRRQEGLSKWVLRASDKRENRALAPIENMGNLRATTAYYSTPLARKDSRYLRRPLKTAIGVSNYLYNWNYKLGP